MAYVKSTKNNGTYNGLAGFWGQAFPDIPGVARFSIPTDASGSFISTHPWRHIYTFSPYVGMKTPPKLFGPGSDNLYPYPYQKMMESEI